MLIMNPDGFPDRNGFGFVYIGSVVHGDLYGQLFLLCHAYGAAEDDCC